MNKNASSPRRLGILIAGLIVAAVAAGAVFSSLRPVTEVDPNTSVGVVQTFFRAVEGRDWEGVYALLEPELGEDCREANLPTTSYDFDRVVVDDVIEADGRTTVVVNARHVDASDPLDPYVYEEVLEFQLDSTVVPPVMTRLPWQFYCGG
ncbi:MAG TPA: hypothetical protein VJR05_15255 [Acidimicrobiia bacterium]|nr:hypothetical protein [Acidimicrobiia bacterium]